MRRSSGAYRRHDEGGEQGFWPSYADMMSAVALIIFFLMLLSYIQNLVTGNDLQNTQELLSDTKEQVSLAEQQLADLSLQLSDKQSQLEDYAGQLVEQGQLLLSQQQMIGQQADYLQAADKELTQMRDQMQTIAVLRLSILEQIRESIIQVMGPGTQVSIGDNGSIMLSDSVLFDLGSSQIRADSVQLLDELINVFYQFLSNSDNSRYVDSIVIAGHTDSSGTDETNRQLSTSRANSVLGYLLTGQNAKLKDFSQYFCAAGYAATRPIAPNDSPEGQAANRRIEISIILKDESVLKIVENYLAMDLPAAAPTALPSPSPAA